MRKNAFFAQVPRTDNSPEWENIINRIPEAETVDGMKFVERVVLPTTVPNRKNRRGETQNIARQAGTGERDQTLIGSFQRGIDVREMPPKLIKDGNHLSLYGGYGRSKIFEELKYKFWVYDIYEYDVSTRNHLQTSHLEVLEDAAISDNGAAKCKPASKADYVGILVKRIMDHGWDRDRMYEWFNSIDHCLTKKQVKEYITSAVKENKRQGRIESIDKDQAERIVTANKPEGVKLHILNTTDAQNGNTQRIIRSCIPVFRNYIDSKGETQKFAIWNSQACTHEELDDAAKGMEKIMDEIWKLARECVIAQMHYGTPVWEIEYVINQKIGGNHQVCTLVPIEESFSKKG